MRQLRLATRESPLAMWQARHVAHRLRQAWPALSVTLVPLTSSGDQDQSTPLYGMGNVGVFSREVHSAVLRGEADVAVHSCKDLPTTAPDGIAAPIILERDDPRDALIGAASISDLPHGAVVGSSSLRRRCQLAALRPDITFTSIRGNIQTRMRKVGDGEVAATLLACAGLKRMGLMHEAHAVGLCPWEELVPAPAQGALAVDYRLGDSATGTLLSALSNHETTVAVTIERQILAGLRGGCSLPLGCYATRLDTRWLVRARLGTEDDKLIEVEHLGPADGMAEIILEALTASQHATSSTEQP